MPQPTQLQTCANGACISAYMYAARIAPRRRLFGHMIVACDSNGMRASCAPCALRRRPRQLSKRLNELGSQLTRQQNAAQVHLGAAMWHPASCQAY